MNRPLLVSCAYQGDTFCALWLEGDGDYVLGWMVGVPSEMGKEPKSTAKLRYKDREQAAQAFQGKVSDLGQMVL